MKNISKLLALAVIVLMTSFTTKVMAQGTVTGTTAGANILAPITLAQTANLNFGSMSVAVATSGTCVLSTQGVRSATGGVSLSPILPAPSNAAYTVTGSPESATYVIMLPGTITVTHTNLSTTMTIGTLLARTTNSPGADGLTGTLAIGVDAFTVGGTLTVAGGQLGGVYSGTFNVTVGYN